MLTIIHYTHAFVRVGRSGNSPKVVENRRMRRYLHTSPLFRWSGGVLAPFWSPEALQNEIENGKNIEAEKGGKKRGQECPLGGDESFRAANNTPSRGSGESPPYLTGEPFRADPGGTLAPQDAPRCPATPATARRRQDEMRRDVSRRSDVARRAPGGSFGGPPEAPRLIQGVKKDRFRVKVARAHRFFPRPFPFLLFAAFLCRI